AFVAFNSPAAIASSRISLNRCESNLGSEQSIEQKSLQWELTLDIKLNLSKYGSCASQTCNAFLPIHVTLALLVQIHQIIFFRVRSLIVCFELLNISFRDLLVHCSEELLKILNNISSKVIIVNTSSLII
ncbi:hypothetical protein V8G54_020220, partial [Vigna mungo]